MPDSLIDLSGLRVGAEQFLAIVLEATEQPIWVVDHDGVIRFANPAAIAALGYERADELSGRRSHETIHHKRPDGTPIPEADCPLLRPLATGATVTSELDWFVRRDGSTFPVSYVSVPIDLQEGRGAVVVFTDIEDRLRTEEVLREHDAVLAAQQASLRRVAMLVAGGAASADVFAAIAREVGHVIGLPLVAIWRYETDGTASVVGAWSDRPHPFEVGITLAARRADDLRADPGDRPAGADQRLLGGGRHDRRRRPRHRDPRVRRRADRRRRPAVGRDVDRRDRGRDAARRRGGPARRVHRARGGDVLDHRPPGRARPARRRAGGAAAGGDARRPRRPGRRAVRRRHRGGRPAAPHRRRRDDPLRGGRHPDRRRELDGRGRRGGHRGRAPVAAWRARASRRGSSRPGGRRASTTGATCPGRSPTTSGPGSG